jgi:hypothetical protein
MSRPTPTRHVSFPRTLTRHVSPCRALTRHVKPAALVRVGRQLPWPLVRSGQAGRPGPAHGPRPGPARWRGTRGLRREARRHPAVGPGLVSPRPGLPASPVAPGAPLPGRDPVRPRPDLPSFVHGTRQPQPHPGAPLPGQDPVRPRPDLPSFVHGACQPGFAATAVNVPLFRPWRAPPCWGRAPWSPRRTPARRLAQQPLRGSSAEAPAASHSTPLRPLPGGVRGTSSATLPIRGAYPSTRPRVFGPRRSRPSCPRPSRSTGHALPVSPLPVMRRRCIGAVRRRRRTRPSVRVWPSPWPCWGRSPRTPARPGWGCGHGR